MAKKTTRVVILRRDTLDANELEALLRKCPKRRFQFIRTDPADYKEHDELCIKLRADFVFLPREHPIPTDAMKRGVPHLSLTPNGLEELIALVPQFKPFEPKRNNRFKRRLAP